MSSLLKYRYLFILWLFMSPWTLTLKFTSSTKSKSTESFFFVNAKRSFSSFSSFGEEASSIALKVHKQYTMQPPHDMTMYSILQVSPNATAAQITKSYHRLTRKYHPDKLRHYQHNNNNNNHHNNDKNALEEIQQAYEILKDDTTRLLYHKYGMSDPNLAVILLLGPKNPHHFYKLNPLHIELLHLMGYDASSILHDHHQNNNNHNHKNHHQMDDYHFHYRQRSRIIAAHVVELLRPIIEGSVDRNLVAHQLAQDCDRWKTLPMGAQIIRCIGRAYRHAGQDYLNQHYNNNNNNIIIIYSSTPIRQKWRTAKGYCEALWATGRATVTEQIWTKQQRRLQQQQQQKRKQQQQQQQDSINNSIEYKNLLDELDDFWAATGADSDCDVDENDNILFSTESHEDIRRSEQFKAQKTILNAMHVEALWQVTKIHLDRTVQNACKMVLSGRYFFFPSHQSTNPDEWDNDDDDHYYNHGKNNNNSCGNKDHGWVGSSGKVVYAKQAQIEAAKMLVFLGNIMVQRSKEGTAWKE